MFNYIPSIHDSFNAKTLSTKSLCETFIVNDYFSKIAGHSHSILIGPRGSGKTTLLKMLQVEALEYWQSEQANDFRNTVSYCGVFIPTDRAWKYQYELLSKSTDEENLRGKLNSIFIFHVLEKLVSTIEFRANNFIEKKNKYLHVNISKEQESNLVRHLSDYWRISPKTLTLKSLSLEILSVKNKISESLLKNTESIIEIENSFHINQLVPILDISVKSINLLLDQHEQKWCFLFDELELAPEEIIQPLVDSIRGGPDNIIFKLSMSPYHGGITVTNSPYSPMPGQDHMIINLSNNKPEKAYDFAKKLCGQIFKKKGYENDVASYFEASKVFDRKSVFFELSKKDTSFDLFLKNNNIDLNLFESYKEADKLPTIRKIQFVALLRNHYLKTDKDGRLLRRSVRTPPDFYVGFENICKAMEYNPRMLIGMTNMFTDILGDDTQFISLSLQKEILEKTYRSYQSLLNTISVDYQGFNTLYEFIDFLAEFCAQYIKGDKFVPEPYGAFLFDKEPSEIAKKAIGYALNSGALISENIGVTYLDLLDMKGLKIRLSYMFAHHYGLLLNGQREIKFDSIFIPQSKHQLDLL